MRKTTYKIVWLGKKHKLYVTGLSKAELYGFNKSKYFEDVKIFNSDNELLKSY